jgi:uncharacterized membrane protein YkoI
MTFARPLLTLLLLVSGAVGGLPPADAGERLTCLPRHERRAAVQSRQVLPLGRVLRMTRARINGDVLRARLCLGANGGFVYLLTVLSWDGKVTRMLLDADTGRYIGGR